MEDISLERVRAELAPTGQMRAAINVANAAVATVNEQTGEVSGLSADIARKLSEAIGVAVSIVKYPTAGSILEAAARGDWDIAFIAEDPARAERFSFSPPYTTVEATYLVPSRSRFRSVEDFDVPGNRISATSSAAYALHMRRSLKHAEIVEATTPTDAIEKLIAESCEAAAGIRQSLEKVAHERSGYRVVEGSFSIINQTLAVRKEMAVAAAFVHDFVLRFQPSS